MNCWNNDLNYKEMQPTTKVSPRKSKKRARHLRNMKLKQEAEQINEHATKREIEELFRCVKSDGSAFKNTKQTNKCAPEQLTTHYKKHRSDSLSKIQFAYKSIF